MHKTFTSTWTVSQKRRNLHRKHIRVGDANRCRTKYEAIHFLTHHKIGHEGNDVYKVVFFLSCRDRPFLSIYFPFMHERQYAWQQMNLSTRHKCVCGMGLGVCHEIKWLRLELFVLIAFLVRHSKCESKLTWARHQSVQPHNHQRIPASTIWSHSLTISSFLLWALNTWSAFIFFSSEKKTVYFRGIWKSIFCIGLEWIKKVYIPLLLFSFHALQQWYRYACNADEKKIQWMKEKKKPSKSESWKNTLIAKCRQEETNLNT